MKKLSTWWSPLAILLTASHPALAQTPTYSLSATMGLSKNSDMVSYEAINDQYSETKESAVGFSIYGSYHYKPGIKFDFGYVNLGEYTLTDLDRNTFEDGTSFTFLDDKSDIETTGFILGSEFSKSVSSNTELNFSIGLMQWDFDVTYTEAFYDADGSFIGTEGRSGSESGTDLYYGFGAKYKINNQLSATGQFVRYGLDIEGFKTDFDVISIGINYWLDAKPARKPYYAEKPDSSEPAYSTNQPKTSYPMYSTGYSGSTRTNMSEASAKTVEPAPKPTSENSQSGDNKDITACKSAHRHLFPMCSSY